MSAAEHMKAICLRSKNQVEAKTEIEARYGRVDLTEFQPFQDLPEAKCEDYWTLDEGYFSGIWICEIGQVNIDDLVDAGTKPGAIVRVHSQDAIRYIPGCMDGYERVAGLISDAA